MHTSRSHCYEEPHIISTGCLKDSWQVNYEEAQVRENEAASGRPCRVGLSCLSRLAGYLTHLGAC